MKKLITTLLTATLLTVANSHAAIFLWNNSGTMYTNATSWTNGVAPASTSGSTTTDDLQFGSVGANFNTVDLTTARSAKSVTFLTGANAYTFMSSSNRVLGVSAGITNNSTATQTFNLAVENANANNTWTQVTGGTMVFNNVVGITSSASSTSRTITLAGGGTFTFNGAINNGGTATAGKLTIANAGGTVNLNATNNLGGGVVITAGTVNFNNAAAFGTGLLELGSTTGTSYGNSVLNNASGSAITLTGISGVLWSGVTPAGVQIGTASSTAANNIDFGTGLVTTTTSRQMNIAGTGVTISMGTLTTTGTGNGYTYTFDGIGNTMDLDGWRISTASVPTQNVVHQLKGSANLNIGLIENGTAGWTNGVEFNSTGVTRITGNNTYTGTTGYLAGTNIVTGNNSAASGTVTLSGPSGTTKMPYVRLDSLNAISSASIIAGSSSTQTVGTLDLNGGTNYTFNSFGGGNMNFTNSFASPVTVTFTNANNILTSSAGSSGGRLLYNVSTNLLIVMNGGLDIGSSASGVTNTIGGVGNWNIKGDIVNNAVGSVRALRKNGSGLLTMEGNNNYNGDTSIEGGTLLLLGTLSNSLAQINGGTFDLRGTSSGINLNTGTLDVRGTGGLLTQLAGTATVYSGGRIGDNTVSGGLLEVYGTAGVTTINTNGIVNVKTGGIIGTTTVGGGTLLVDGTTGATTINSGTATVNSGGTIGTTIINGSLLSVNGIAGNVLVNSGGTLGGSGTVGAITLNGGTVAPGNSPGLLTASSLDASNGSFSFQLGAPTTRGVTYDAIDVTSLLTLGANTTWSFQVDGGYTFQQNDTYDLFNWGSIDTTGFDISVFQAALPDLNTATTDLKWDVNNFTVDGTINVIPEPDTGVLLVTGACALGIIRRINRKKK